ncbi:unnamed protein product, partial [Didymodactylos carnosus]
NLILKKSCPLEKVRASLTSAQIDHWFELLERVLNNPSYALSNHPNQIYNCDETGFADGCQQKKVLVHRGTSNPYKVQGGTGGKSFTSVLICASATGTILPPYIIYKAKRLFGEWCINGPPGSGYATTPNGWMNKNAFFMWFKDIFLTSVKDVNRPILLFLDGHKSHFMVKTIQLAIENQIMIVCLPPHSSHILQPLDVVFFAPVKIKWKNILSEYYKSTHNKNISKAIFPVLLNKLWQSEAMKKSNVIKGFMKAGIYPLDKDNINYSRLLKNSNSVQYLSSSASKPIVTTAPISITTIQEENEIEDTTGITNMPLNNFDPRPLSSSTISYAPSATSFPLQLIIPTETARFSVKNTQARSKKNRFCPPSKLVSNLDDLVDSDSENKSPPSSQTDRSLKAITDTIFHVLTPKIDMSLTTTTKRTILKRSSGEIVTEDNVLKQLQAREKQEEAKQAKASRPKAPKKFKRMVTTEADVQSSCLESHNSYRSHQGVPLLKTNPVLVDFAKNVANELARQDNRCHPTYTQ